MNDDRDRDRLVKILRMFSSDHDGEVAAAARRAHDLVKARSLDWDDLIIKDSGNHPYNYPLPRNSEIALIRGCADCDEYLNAFERNFIESIHESVIEWGKLTPRQRAVLDRIVTKLKTMGVWRAGAPP